MITANCTHGEALIFLSDKRFRIKKRKKLATDLKVGCFSFQDNKKINDRSVELDYIQVQVCLTKRLPPQQQSCRSWCLSVYNYTEKFNFPLKAAPPITVNSYVQ